MELPQNIRREHAVVSVFFDLEKVYDTTWKYGILRDLDRARTSSCISVELPQ